MHREVQGGNGKNTNHKYPKNNIITQDASTNTNNRITVTQDAPTNRSNRINKGTDSYFELFLKSLRDHIARLENQLKDKQFIIEELIRKIYQSFCNYSVANSNLVDAQKYHTKCTENDFVNFAKHSVKNSIDLNSGNSSKDFTITSSSSHKKLQKQQH